jgi:hypothetical protein
MGGGIILQNPSKSFTFPQAKNVPWAPNHSSIGFELFLAVVTGVLADLTGLRLTDGFSVMTLSEQRYLTQVDSHISKFMGRQPMPWSTKSSPLANFLLTSIP